VRLGVQKGLWWLEAKSFSQFNQGQPATKGARATQLDCARPLHPRKVIVKIQLFNTSVISKITPNLSGGLDNNTFDLGNAGERASTSSQ
jgi:hypothetical protein